jgi:hypothetical protein
VVSLAGPATGIAIGCVALVVQPAAALSGGPWPQLAADVVWVNIGWGLLNLLPILPLDGGQIAETMLRLAGRGGARREALLLSLATAAAIVVGAIVAGFPFAALLVAWLSAGNIEALRAIGDESLSGRVTAHQRELLDGAYDRAIDGLLSVERDAKSEAAASAARSGAALTMLAADRFDDAAGIVARSGSGSISPVIALAIELRRGRLDPALVERLSGSLDVTSTMAVARAAVEGDRLEELIRQLVELPDRSAARALLNLQIGLHFVRRHHEAIRVAELGQARRPDSPSIALFLAGDHAALGAPDEAMAALVRAADLGLTTSGWLDLDPLLEPLHSLPAFAEIRERVEANEEAGR